MQSRLGKKDENKHDYAAKGFLVLGPFSRIFSHLSVSWYSILLFKVTLEMLTPKVKKQNKTKTNKNKKNKNKNLHHSKQASESDINDLTPQNEKTTFYFKHKVQVLTFSNNNFK